MDIPTEDEIYEQIDKALDKQNRWPGMSYEEGVDNALRWVLDPDNIEPPMFEEE